MPTRVAINGFGRIGRQAFKVASQVPGDSRVVAINDIGDVANMAYLLKHDTVHRVDHADRDRRRRRPRRRRQAISRAGSHRSRATAVEGPRCRCRHRVHRPLHQTRAGRGAPRSGGEGVVISAPAKGAPSFVLGVNEAEYDPERDTIISNASCTTNSITPVMAVLDEKFGVAKALMTTVHSYTADQRLVDSPHSDLRRGRAAAQNIVPTSTGAAVAATEALPQLKGMFDGVSLRVPTLDVSLSDLTVLLKTQDDGGGDQRGLSGGGEERSLPGNPGREPTSRWFRRTSSAIPTPRSSTWN